MWTHIEKRRRLVLASVPLVVAVSVLIFQSTATHFGWRIKQDRRQARVQQFHDLTRLMALRMSLKSKELQKRGVKQPELKRELDEEAEAARIEANRVMASGYKLPYDMNSR